MVVVTASGGGRHLHADRAFPAGGFPGRFQRDLGGAFDDHSGAGEKLNFRRAGGEPKNLSTQGVTFPAVGFRVRPAGVEEVIDELTQAIFTLNTPRWATDEQADNVEKLKKKAQEVYAKYLQAST